MHSSPAKAAAITVGDEVATAEAGADRAADAVKPARVQEVTATAPEIPVIVQVEPKGAAAVAAEAVPVPLYMSPNRCFRCRQRVHRR